MNNSHQQPILEVNNATVYRGDNKVMDHFSLAINQLEHTAIVGPNGSGKSTLIQLLTHQLHPLAPKDGKPVIRVFGEHRWKVSELRKRIGIVSADLEYEIVHNLKKGYLTGREVVMSGFFSSMQLFEHYDTTDEMREKAAQALEKIESTYLADRILNQMSAGEKRRVLIARALVTNPDMLILDEPTTALDFVARQNCLKLIQDIAQEGTTVIIVTHHVSEVIPEIQKVILLRDGRAAYSGPKQEVLTSEVVSSVFDHPVTITEFGETYRVEMDL
ncbi:ATP-binding cassette domain-containing protein [Aliifodinibius sp. S!AR15-10]|uniref:ABC transporter ATP-binding protein n=1 Tax=Aliifodinibius sp. S!AR15-10 TaxID=2950437 RepID=UPI002857B42F|nr:ATP-binding cassette domain-containing protein [Aliifodinibius sp. S!AR15-10]MDR8393634.1 ATP-binding cassette domain-containing protein [Aliifodinibius sp. S!AR15-10]